MSKRDFLKLSDLNLSEARSVLALAHTLKHEPKGARTKTLAGHSIAVVLEKPSTRTRVSFEVGISQLGGYPVILQSEGSQLGRGEPVRDAARVLARYCDAIVYRTSRHERLVEMASVEVPVINALSDDGHPMQVLCDVFTIEEALGSIGQPKSPQGAARRGSAAPPPMGSIAGQRVAFIGDCSSNMARSFVEAAKLFEFHLVLSAPEGYFPPKLELDAAGPHVSIERDPRVAVANVAVINTDVWTSMGQETENERRLRAFSGFTVDQAMMANARPETFVLHCLPAHRGEEIDAATLEGPRSRVWDQAENRLHVQKALLVWLHEQRG